MCVVSETTKIYTIDGHRLVGSTSRGTMNQIVVKRDARDLGITNPVGCIIQGLDVQTEAHLLDEDVSEMESMVEENFDEIIGKREVEAYHELFARMGYPDQIPAGEKRLGLIEKRGLNRHNNVVDAYNIASAEFGTGLGMHDVSHIDGDVVVQLASGGERVRPLFETNYATARPGDLLYSVGDRVLALLGHIVADSDKHKVTDTTEEVLLVSLGNHETSEKYNRDACQMAYDLISKTCPDATMEFLDVVYEDADRLVAP